MSKNGPPYLTTRMIHELVPMSSAIEAIHEILLSGFEPAEDLARTSQAVAHGHILLMPSESERFVGVKIASVVPDNPNHKLPRIQAIYALMDSKTLTPVLLMDGTALTSLRTPAVSAVAARELSSQAASKLVVFGTGPQAWGHVLAIRDVRPVADVTVIARDPSRSSVFVEQVKSLGLRAKVGEVKDVTEADIVVCATSSPTPLFDGDLVRDDVCVIAVGSHEPNYRELDDALLERGDVIVEDVETSMREAGDIIQAIAAGAISLSGLKSLVEIVNDPSRQERERRPQIFKGVGMSWQDLAVATRVWDRFQQR